VSCAQTDDLISMQRGMLSQVSPGNMYDIGIERLLREGALLGLSGWLKCTVMDFGNCIKLWAEHKTDGLTLIICTSYDAFLRKSLPFVGCNDGAGIRIFSCVKLFWSQL